MPAASENIPSASIDSPIRVAVVEDDVACRVALQEAVQEAPDMELAWAAGNRHDALQALDQAQGLHVLLVDLGLPDGSGLDVIRACRAHSPQTAAMVSTIFGDETHVIQAIEAGAMGYLLKDLAPSQVLDELRSLHAGGSPINPMVARKLLLRQSAPPEAPQLQLQARPTDVPDDAADTALSVREAEVLRLVARGHTLDEVARSMGVTRHTVRSFVRRIYAKLQVGSRAQAVHTAYRQGLLKDDEHAG